MKKIMFVIKDGNLQVQYKIENNSIKNINNTNIINSEDLIFDIRYFKNNTKLIAGFLNVIIRTENIKTASVIEEELIIPTLEFLNYIPNIEKLTIVPDISIEYDIHLAILKNDTLKKINCYTIPTYLLERIDTTKSVKIETRNEVFFMSNFLRVNKLNSYSDVYYKRTLIISYDFNDSDYKDFVSFLTINVHLRKLYFEYVSLNLIKNIINHLKKFDRKNISIEIKGTVENLIYFGEIESFVKKSKYLKKNNIHFKIDYTKEYKLENFIKLLNYRSVVAILIAIIVSAVLASGLKQYDLYKSKKQTTDITNDIFSNERIADILERNSYLENLEPPEESTEEQSEVQEETPSEPEQPKSTYVSPYYKSYAEVVSVLKESNPDTVGWLSVAGTSINYPVVISNNNSYYLTHDFNRNSNSLGWIYMDYRNNPSDLNQNTIIFGHNIYGTQIMFGSLPNLLTEKWYNNRSNHIITFNTANADMKWEVFSVYSIEANNDYMYTSFGDSEEFLEFVNKMRNRSVFDFSDVVVNENDKLLTLSTCQNRGKNRLVVHARLIS